MPVIVDAPLSDNFQSGNLTTTEDGMFIFPFDKILTTADLMNAINIFKNSSLGKLEKKYKYYRGKHDILAAPKNEPYKPDNRIVINFPRRAVSDFTGFFIGTMVKIDSPDNKIDQTIQEWENENNFEDIALEVSKEASEFGHSYFYVYQDVDGSTKVTTSSVLNTFIIYDNTQAHNSKYAVQFTENANGELVITLFDDFYIREFTESNGGLVMTSSIINPYNNIPVIEVLENSDRMGLCDDVVTLIDALDKAMSEKANDVNYFSDAYLKMVNVELEKDELKSFRENRVINVTGDSDGGQPDISFIEKPSADETQEHLIDRLVSSIYSIAGLVNINDENFGGNPTGVALQMKFKPMQNMAKAKSLKFKASLRQVFQCVFAVNDTISNDAWKQLTFKFTQNIPTNIGETAQLLEAGFGRLPTKILYSQMPFIEDPDQAVKDFQAEQKQGQVEVQGLLSSKIDQPKTNPSGDGVDD